MISIKCNCGETYKAEKQHVGRHIRCKCGTVLEIVARINPPNVSGSREPMSPSATKSSSRFTDTILRRIQQLTARGWLIPASVIVVIITLWAIDRSVNPPKETKTNVRRSTPAIVDRATATSKPVSPAIVDPAVSAAPTLEVPIQLEPVNPNRLTTGSTPVDGAVRSGNSKITVDNGTDTDAIVRVVRFRKSHQQHVRNFYVRSQEHFVATFVPPGEYVLRVAFGTDWNSAIRKFNYRRSFSETQTFVVDETRWTETSEDGEVVHTKSSGLSITLHKVPHGNFESRPINEEEFWH
jgi:hypothetical protein